MATVNGVFIGNCQEQTAPRSKLTTQICQKAPFDVQETPTKVGSSVLESQWARKSAL